METAAPPGSLGLELQFLLADRGAGEAGAGNLTCAALQTGSDWVVLLDLTWGGWPGLQAAANAASIPLLRLDSVNHLVGLHYDSLHEFNWPPVDPSGSGCCGVARGEGRGPPDGDRARAGGVVAMGHRKLCTQVSALLYCTLDCTLLHRLVVASLEQKGVLARLSALRPAPAFWLLMADQADLAPGLAGVSFVVILCVPTYSPK